MRRSIEFWAVVGGLLCVIGMPGAGVAGCVLEDPEATLGAGGAGGAGANSSSTASMNTTVGTGDEPSSSGAGGGGGGKPFSCDTNCYDADELSTLVPNPLLNFAPGQVAYVKGTLASGSREFTFSLGKTGIIRFETYSDSESGVDCGDLDTVLEVKPETTEAFLIREERNGISDCASLSAHLSSASSYKLKLSSNSPTNDSVNYILKIESATPLSGMMGSNDCDKVNMGSIATNNSDLVYCSGDVNLGIDKNTYTIKADGKSLFAEILEGTATDDMSQCENNSHDFTLVLKRGQTILVEDDDSGRGECPLINGLGATRIHSKANAIDGEVTLEVSQPDSSDFTKTKYNLLVRLVQH
ncbi:MAG TPA: hypothetical protein VE093_14105 [Polyangiaceae bacterium]|nr:hypothetical protein [Polyangiaceae bacterium]